MLVLAAVVIAIGIGWFAVFRSRSARRTAGVGPIGATQSQALPGEPPWQPHSAADEDEPPSVPPGS
jgi:hypothetical protein